MELGQTVIIALLGPKSPLLVRISVPKPKMVDTFGPITNQAKITFQRQKCVIFVLKVPQAFKDLYFPKKCKNNGNNCSAKKVSGPIPKLDTKDLKSIFQTSF